MWNTCLIGRRWKPREGWSRPVLTGDGDIAAHSPSCVWGWVRVFFCCGIVGDKERCSCGHETVFASAVRFPDRHGTRRWRRVGGFLWPVGVPVLGVRAVGGGFCGGHGPGVTPGPFPNPEAKAWHGDGTAPGRVWESNTPPQTFLLDPRRAFARRGFFVSTTNRHPCYIGVGELVESAIQGKRRADTRLPFVVCIRRIGPPL